MDKEAYKSHARELSDEDELLDDVRLYASQKEAILFVLQVSPSMMASSTDNLASPVVQALECAFQFMTHKIIATPSDVIGVMLYGTQETDCPAEYGYTSCENVSVLVDMGCPDALKMKHLKAFLANIRKSAAVLRPAPQLPSLANILFLVNGIFSQKAANFNYKRVILVTDNDDPCDFDKETKQAAITRARDLNDLGIKIEPIFMRREGSTFDTRKFYDDIVYREDDDADQSYDLIAEGDRRMDHMMDRIYAKVSPKRAIFSIPMEITRGLSIGIKGYISFKELKISKSANIYNEGEKPQLVTNETTNICLDSSKVLDKIEVRKAFKFGSERVVFTQTELKELKQVENPILRIIAFKTFDNLKFWHNIRPAYFIYPSELSVIGSTRVFAALHASLIEKQKWALAWFIPRRNANPAVVAILAAEESLDEDLQTQRSPPGFHVITMPFADDIRQNPPQTVLRATSSLVDKMSNIIHNLRLPNYDPKKYQNPALQWHWRILQAMALEEDMPEAAKDPTLPKFKGIEKRAGQFIEEWTREWQSTAMKQSARSTEKRAGEKIVEQRSSRKRSRNNVSA